MYQRPDIYHMLIVPLTTSVPSEGKKGQWGRAPSLYRAVPQDGWPGVSNPVTIVVNA